MKRNIFALALLFSPLSLASANGTVSIDTISPNTNVSAGTSISLQIDATNFPSSPYYTLSDSFPGSSLSNSNINRFGKFNWTTSPIDVGTHDVTFFVTDSNGGKSSVTKTFIIRPASPISIQEISPGTSIFANKTLSLLVAAPGFSNPSFSVSDSFYGSSLSTYNISQYGTLTWTPTQNDVGVHNLTIYVTTPNGRTDSISQTITVNGMSVKNVSASSLPVGTPFSFNIVSHGLNSPTYSVTDSTRNNTITSENLNGTNFNWIPKDQDIGTHNISVTANDADGNTMTSKLTVTINSNVPAPVVTTPSPIATPVTFKSNLQVGSKGSEVVALQKLLAKLKFFSGPTNGNFGQVTKAAVIKFQKANGISALGVVGPATRAALNKK